MNDINQQVLQTLKNKLGSAFQSYYDGDPAVFPQGALPSIVVSTSRTTGSAGPTGFDRLVHTVEISIVLDKTADFGQDPESAVTHAKLRQNVVGQDDSQQYSPFTLLGILRTDLTLAGYVTSQSFDVDYLLQVRPDQSVTAEATLKVSFGQLVPVVRVPQPN
jgi:hypothetical protein